ncbi:GL18485 [Drosophila persimilis]|uniref:GL18485 n=1 Tax=Drosophila persimilis TaxID=7234 RepID=B4G7N6_DROPE|nr:GL18485 [Drosophila persimilis]
MNRSLAMLERRLRSQRLEPTAPIPTKTTTLRRQVCVNIEAKGSSPSLRPRRRRRRELLMSYPYPFSQMSMPMDYGQPQQLHQAKGDLHYGYFDPVESFLQYQNLGCPQMRMNSGQEYGMKYAPTLERNNRPRSFFTNVNSSGHQSASVDELKVIASTLESSLLQFLANESEPVHKELNKECVINPNYESGGPQESKMQLLTDMMCDTIYRLNSFISTQREIGGHKSPYMIPPHLLSQPQPTYNMGLGSEGLKSNSLLFHPSNMMAANHNSRLPPVESTEASTQTRFSVVRMPWLRERRRKRLVKPTYIHLHNQGCSTEDLDLWPRILEAITNINSGENHLKTEHFEQQSSKKSMKDSGTTMWCPMACCRGYCDAAMTSSSTSDIRSAGGVRNTQLTYSYIEEQQEEQPKSTDSLDDWYRSASMSLAELEEEQEHYKAMEERRKKLNTRNKRLQTESITSSASIGVCVGATAEKAVSTSDLNACRLKKPLKSALKTRRVKSGQEIVGNTAPGLERLTKVKFEKKVVPKLQGYNE